MRNKIILIAVAACMPAILSAGTIPASSALSGGGLLVAFTTTIPTIDDYLVILDCTVALSSCTPTSPGAGSAVYLLGASLPPLTIYPFMETICGCNVSGWAATIGLDSTGTEVVISLADTIGITGITSNTWSSLFPSTPESQIVADLTVHDTAGLADLTDFFEANLTDFVGFGATGSAGGELGEFSSGVNVGNILLDVHPGPEPGTLILTGSLLGGLLFARRSNLKFARTRRGRSRGD